jgi:hypothetical protein
MATLVTHCWNEVALIEMWIDHHNQTFDKLIVIDFASDDGTRDILKDKGVTIVDSPLSEFSARPVDELVEQVEANIIGPRISLNVTEFLLGDPNVDRELLIPSVCLVNMDSDPDFDWSIPFHRQRDYGIGFERDFYRRRSRRLSLEPKPYPLGRHFHFIDRGELLIAHVAQCYVDQRMIDRRLAIQHRIPESDKQKMLGYQHHNMNRGLTFDDVMAEQFNDRRAAQDLSEYLRPYR